MSLLAKRALTVLIAIPLLIFWLWAAKAYDQPWLIIALLGIVVGLGSWEYAKLMERMGLPLETLSFVSISVLSVIAGGVSEGAHVPLIFTAAALILLGWHLPRREGMKSSAAAILGLFYLPYLLHFAYGLYRPEDGFSRLVGLLALVWAYDTGAYLVGSRWGRHKLSPEISPQKSWEGVLGGWALAWVMGLVLSLWVRWGPIHAFALSILISASAQLGDLFESKLKRSAGVKDSGGLFPGHGGMLDRIDGLLFALPVFYFYLHYVLEGLGS